MIDRLLCKAKEEGTGKWVYGYYVFQPSAGGSADMIFSPAANPDESNKVYFIDPKTVCQATPYLDMDGRRLYECDIIQGEKSRVVEGISYTWSGEEELEDSRCVYVGNIHDVEDCDSHSTLWSIRTE